MGILSQNKPVVHKTKERMEQNFMVFEKIRALLSEQLDIEEDEITMESKLAEDLGADSLDVVDLIMAIEDEFEVEVLDEDIEKVVTVGDIVNYVSDNR
jgi:acyl carrier protein